MMNKIIIDSNWLSSRSKSRFGKHKESIMRFFVPFVPSR